LFCEFLLLRDTVQILWAPVHLTKNLTDDLAGPRPDAETPRGAKI